MSDGGPVIFARVYDSRITDNVDLGPGWRLSLAEKISPEAGGSYLYLDGSGTRHRFVDGEAGYVVSPPTPGHNRTQLSMVNEKIVLHEADGTVRTFGLFSGNDSYQIVSLSTAQNRLEFHYEDGLLARIDSDGEMLFELSRGTHEERKIVAVTDRHGRSVRYKYTDGRLQDVHDLVGNIWEHNYNSMGLLTVAMDANGQPYLEASFDKSGETQVQSLDIGAMNRVERIEYEGWLGVDVKYDEMDRPIAFRKLTDDVTLPTPAEFVEIAYTETGRIAKIESQTTGESWVPEDGWPIDEANIVNDPRAEILGRKLRGKAHPDYGVVEFVETTFDAIPVAPLELGVPSLRKATSLQSLASGLLSPRQVNAIIQFEKASNPVFQPPEYRSTNCCVPCLGSGCECWLIRWDFENFCGCADLLDYFTKITEFLLRQEQEQEEEEERRCRPCSPPVGTKMYLKHTFHPPRHVGYPGYNHGVPGYIHYHHFVVHQRPTEAPQPCLCWAKNSISY